MEGTKFTQIKAQSGDEKILHRTQHEKELD